MALFLSNLILLALWPLLAFVMFQHDLIVTFLLRPVHRRFFPMACAMARSLTDEPELWSYEYGRTTHLPTGVVIHSSGGGNCEVMLETRVGNWKPSVVSRRIIRTALDQRSRRVMNDLSSNYFDPRNRNNQLRLSYEPVFPQASKSS
jgi:hypothetical protein